MRAGTAVHIAAPGRARSIWALGAWLALAPVPDGQPWARAWPSLVAITMDTIVTPVMPGTVPR